MTQAPFPAQSILFLSHDQRGDITTHLAAHGIAIENNPDVFMIESEKALGIDDVRTLQTWSMDKPYAHDWKVAVLLAAETLTLPAQNAMLKLLEEPTEHTFLVLMCTNANALLATVQSRCTVLQEHQKLDAKSSLALPKTRAERDTLLESIGKTREDAIAFCEAQLRQFHAQLEKQPSSRIAFILRQLQACLRLLRHNVSVKLALEALFYEIS